MTDMHQTDLNFATEEDGAVTVDWVVLTAALVGLGLAVMGVVSVGVQNASEDIEGQLKSEGMIRTSFTGLSGASALSSDQFASITQTATDSSNASLATEYSNALGSVHADYGDWTAGIADGTYKLDETTGEYSNDDGSVTFAKSTYDASSASVETASIYADEAQQRGLTWNETNGAFE